MSPFTPRLVLHLIAAASEKAPHTQIPHFNDEATGEAARKRKLHCQSDISIVDRPLSEPAESITKKESYKPFWKRHSL